MNAVLETSAAGKKYGRRWALQDCTLTIPAGQVVGLVGPNGAGKTTLLQLAAGLLTPTSGTVTVLGGRPGTSPGPLARVGFVAQDALTRSPGAISSGASWRSSPSRGPASCSPRT